MVRIATQWIIAVVANVYSFWNWAKVKFPGHTMNANSASAIRKHSPISRIAAITLPFPTFSERPWCHSVPESICEGAIRFVVRTVPTDKTDGLPFHQSAIGTVPCGKGSRLTTTTFTEFWGIMRLHKKFSFLCQAWDALTSPGTFYWGGSTRVLYHESGV
jgi:hypothetical protein